MDNSTEEIVKIAKSLTGMIIKGEQQSEIREVLALPFDVSPRRYYRVFYNSHILPIDTADTAILMELAGGACSLGGGSKELTSDDAFVEVQQFFGDNHLRVPQIYVDARSQKNGSGKSEANKPKKNGSGGSEYGYLLIQDIGDLALHTAVSQAVREGDSEKIDTLSAKTLSLLLQIQKIEQQSECVVFERQQSFEKLREGGQQFINHILKPLEISKAEEEVFSLAFDQLSEEVLSHPKVLSHYDFQPFNIHLYNDELYLIDFQDASLDSPMRDLHSILRDRDMDRVWGKATVGKLFKEYVEKSPYGDIASELYPEYQVWWDTRVSGLFSKLVHLDKREKYKQWIEGTLGRVVRGAEALSTKFQPLSDGLEILLARLPQAKEMLQEEWPAP